MAFFGLKLSNSGGQKHMPDTGSKLLKLLLKLEELGLLKREALPLILRIWVLNYPRLSIAETGAHLGKLLPG